MWTLIKLEEVSPELLLTFLMLFYNYINLHYAIIEKSSLAKASNLSNLIAIDRRDLVFNIINLSRKLKCLMATTVFNVKRRQNVSMTLLTLTSDLQSHNFSIFSHLSVLFPLQPSSLTFSHWMISKKFLTKDKSFIGPFLLTIFWFFGWFGQLWAKILLRKKMISLNLTNI